MADTAGRPQDQERKHRRRSAPSSATAALLDRYQRAMRDELAMILDALQERRPGLMAEVAPELVIGLADPKRGVLWSRAVTLGRELGTAIDPPGDPAAAPAMPAGPPARRRTRPDFG